MLSQSRPASQILYILCSRNRREETFSPKLPSHYAIRYKFQRFFAQCEGSFKKEKKFIAERMHLYNTNQADREGLESFFLRLSGQAALCGWSVAIENIFIAKMKFEDIQRETFVSTWDYSPNHKSYCRARGVICKSCNKNGPSLDVVILQKSKYCR